jgi:geranylgeranylglycerol-phosphate geranylgeranyltransferase
MQVSILFSFAIQTITCMTFRPTQPPIWEFVKNKLSEIRFPVYSHDLGQGRIPFLSRPHLWGPEQSPRRTTYTDTLYDDLEADPLPPGIKYPVWFAFHKIQPLREKIRNFARLARVRNIWPSIAASIASGWVIHPTIPESIRHIRSIKFTVATVNILLVMAASMIINDLCDIPIDIINHPQRPLITGKITMGEAKWAVGILLCLSEMIVLGFLPRHAQIGNHLAILGVILYTPCLKRVFLIKNVFCAALISYSLVFAGLANASITTLYDKNRRLFTTLFSVIFTTSFQKEILLDISDYEGDRANRIPTLATKYGRYNAFMITYIGLTASIFAHSWMLLAAYGPIGVVFSYIMNPLLMALPTVYIDQYSRRSIRKYDGFSGKILAVCLLYFAALSKIDNTFWPV